MSLEDGDWIDTKEAARLLALNYRTLENWRALRPSPGPVWHKLGGRVRYRRADIIAFQEAARRGDDAPGEVRARRPLFLVTARGATVAAG